MDLCGCESEEDEFVVVYYKSTVRAKVYYESIKRELVVIVYMSVGVALGIVLQGFQV